MLCKIACATARVADQYHDLISHFETKSAYKIMLTCWNPKAVERPSFRTLYRDLETIERELILIQKHYKSQKSILSMDSVGGRNTPQSPKSTAGHV